jgi:hypothetical protein
MEPPSKTQIEPKLFHVSFMGTHCGMEFSGYLKEVIAHLPAGSSLDQVLMKRGPRDQEIRFYVLEEVANPLYEKQLADYEIAVAEAEHRAQLAEELRKLQKLQASLDNEIAQIEWQMKGDKK